MNQVTTSEILGRTVYFLEIPERMTQLSNKMTGRIRMALYPELDDRDYDEEADTEDVREERPSQALDGREFPFPVCYQHIHNRGGRWHVSCLSSLGFASEECEGGDLEHMVRWLISHSFEKPQPVS